MFYVSVTAYFFVREPYRLRIRISQIFLRILKCHRILKIKFAVMSYNMKLEIGIWGRAPPNCPKVEPPLGLFVAVHISVSLHGSS